MTEFSDHHAFWLERLAGAAAGALISLVYLLPKNRQEAASRLATSLACGIVFGGETGLYLSARLGLSADMSASEMMLSGSAAASLTAWWALGLLARIAERLGRDRDG